MIIDDEAGIRDLLCDHLCSLNYEVCTASKGQEGIDYIINDSFDIIISDLMMPGVSGLDVLEASRRISPATKIILMSGVGTVENIGSAINKGAHCFIKKPFDLDNITEVVGKL
ncbi:MAG: hypothetical protein A2231_04720 [Candidatus Firestonebacteria bacterium RIFOXYA2_FULL_40_8]|nr:MAG: hypothetical protein A2231_04720 [Candidatus Firestonebacteria bacterium RIFOXYA2_FULL_40_8]